MDSEWLKWVLSVATSTGVLGLTAYLMRAAIGRYLTRSVEYKFEKKIEQFKSDIRSNEKELEQIGTFITSSRREREALLQAKRFEAAEILMRARQSLSEFTMLVEYLKMLKLDEIIKDDNPNMEAFINTLIGPFNIDDKIKTYSTMDKTLPRLFLDERVLRHFDAYESIMLQAATLMKMLSLPVKKKSSLTKIVNLSKVITEIVPVTAEGFEKHGEFYAFYWAKYFYDETLKELRNALSGAANMSKDTESATRLALDTRQASLDIHQSLRKYGLSEDLIKTEDTPAQPE